MDTDNLTQLANDVAIPNTGVIGTCLLAVAGGITAVWGWFRKELDECKSDRKELYNRVDKLHEDVSNLSMRVGQVERPKS